MNNNEFLEEALSSGMAPKDFKNIYSSFLSYKELARKTLHETLRVCRENGIRYQMAFGSLLGLIRDNGQIPWDYDEDIIVPFEDRKQLVEALNKHLNDSYYYYGPETDPKCPHGIIRVVPKGYLSSKIHVDLFFVIGVPGKTKERTALVNRVNYLYRGRLYKLCDYSSQSRNKLKSFLRVAYGRLKYMFSSLQQLDEEYLSICNQNPVKDSVFCTTADRFGITYLYPTKEMWELIPREIDGFEYMIPSNYDEILRVVYGDYNSFPTLDKRINDVVYFQRQLEGARTDSNT